MQYVKHFLALPAGVG